ncbi:MAG: translation initiation factor eIF-1A [Candidatus Heimdallarchaeota archaeon]
MKNLSKPKKGKPKKGGKRKRSFNRSDGPSASVKVIGRDGQPEYVRVRLPREGEILGIVIQTLGADRLKVRCMDKKERIVRIPGKYRKRLWCRQNDIIIVMPWYGMQEDTRADLVYRYYRNQVGWLEEKGYISFD